MKYRKQGLSNTVIPSVYNSEGVRVYIPEKGKINNRPWVQPYFFETPCLQCETPLTMSTNHNIAIRVAFNSVLIEICEPFTLALLRHYAYLAAQTLKFGVYKIVGKHTRAKSETEQRITFMQGDTPLTPP